MDEITSVLMADIDADFEWNSRKDITLESVQPLLLSIEQNGLEVPVVLRKTGERYALVSGFRRFKAFEELEEPTIPAFVREMDDHEARLANFRENGERKNLSFWEEILFIQVTFPSDKRMSEIQRAMNKGYDWVRSRRQIWDLPQTIIDLTEQGVYSARNIEELLKRDPKQQQVAATQAATAKKRGEEPRQIRKDSMTRRHVQGRKNMSRMMNIISEHSLSSDSRVHDLMLWAMGDLTTVKLAAKLKVDVSIFTAIED